jgi:hypothetical protein
VVQKLGLVNLSERFVDRTEVQTEEEAAKNSKWVIQGAG